MPKTTKSKPKGPPSPTVKLLGKCYVAKGMMPKTVSKGLRLVHNFEPPNPKRRLSNDGFRAYFERADAKVGRRYLCRCGWAPHLKHYDADARRAKG